MMRRGAGLDPNQARRQLLEECQHIAALQLAPDEHFAFRIDAMHLNHQLRTIETDRCDRLHDWLLRIVGALTAPTSLALMCRWRSRPQHQKRTLLRDPRHLEVGTKAGSHFPSKETMRGLMRGESGAPTLGQQPACRGHR